MVEQLTTHEELSKTAEDSTSAANKVTNETSIKDITNAFSQAAAAVSEAIAPYLPDLRLIDKVDTLKDAADFKELRPAKDAAERQQEIARNAARDIAAGKDIGEEAFGIIQADIRSLYRSAEQTAATQPPEQQNSKGTYLERMSQPIVGNSQIGMIGMINAELVQLKSPIQLSVRTDYHRPYGHAKVGSDIVSYEPEWLGTDLISTQNNRTYPAGRIATWSGDTPRPKFHPYQDR